MQVTSKQLGSVTVLTVEGELTVPTAPAFLRRVRLMLAPIGVPRVAIDLSGVRRVDSSGFAALVTLLRQAERRGGDVCLVGLASQVRLVLEIMQLHLLFDVCDDVASAVEALAAGGVAAPGHAPQRHLGKIRLARAPLERRVAS